MGNDPQLQSKQRTSLPEPESRVQLRSDPSPGPTNNPQPSTLPQVQAQTVVPQPTSQASQRTVSTNEAPANEPSQTNTSLWRRALNGLHKGWQSLTAPVSEKVDSYASSAREKLDEIKDGFSRVVNTVLNIPMFAPLRTVVNTVKSVGEKIASAIQESIQQQRVNLDRVEDSSSFFGSSGGMMGVVRRLERVNIEERAAKKKEEARQLANTVQKKRVAGAMRLQNDPNVAAVLHDESRTAFDLRRAVARAISERLSRTKSSEQA